MSSKKLKGSYEDYLKGDIYDKIFTFRLKNHRTNTSLLNTAGRPVTFVGKHLIDAYSVILEKNASGQVTQRVIRLVPGEKSIYKDLQSDDTKVPKKKTTLKFVNGYKTIDPSIDPLEFEFLMKANYNASNPDRNPSVKAVYELVDNSKYVKKVIEDDKQRHKAFAFCWNATMDDILPMARVLNVNLNQRPDEIRFELKRIAEANPEMFLQKLDNPSMKIKNYVLEAIERQYLILNTANNSISWASNQNRPIEVAAMGKDVVEAFVHTLTTPEGKIVLETIIDYLSPPTVVKKELYVPSKEEMEPFKPIIVESDAKPQVELSDFESEEVKSLVDEGLVLGIVTTKKPYWIVYKMKNYKGKDAFINALSIDEKLLRSFKYEISNKKK